MNSPYHPNFPVNLAIQPSVSIYAEGDLAPFEQEASIERYGIAGRIWDATYPILSYLTLPTPESELEFSPPCSLFLSSAKGPRTVLELGSGQSLASLHLSDQLQIQRFGSSDTSKSIPDKIYLSDLPDVIPLCQANIDKWQQKLITGQAHQSLEVVALPLSWGDQRMAEEACAAIRSEGRYWTHILLIDLVYFPHLYPLLMRTLLDVTNNTEAEKDAPARDKDKTPEIVLSYKTRSLEFEEPFFVTLAHYFQLTPLLSRKRTRSGVERWAIHGIKDETYTYILRRRSETLTNGWKVPINDNDLMNGKTSECSPSFSAQGGDRSWGWAEIQLGSIEWD